MKVSDGDLEKLRRYGLRVDGGIQGQQMTRGAYALIADVIAELAALRAVADAADALMERLAIDNNGCTTDASEYEALGRALHGALR